MAITIPRKRLISGIAISSIHRACTIKRPRPAALRLEGLVYGGHEAHCLAQGDDDFLVVLEVGVAMRIDERVP
jgi:hypothetical protein